MNGIFARIILFSFCLLKSYFFVNACAKPKAHFLKLKDIDFVRDSLSGINCYNSLNYAPTINHPEHTLVKYVIINIHFMRKSDGIGSFEEEEGIAYAKNIVYHANQSLLNNKPMNLPIGNSTPNLETRYQYFLTGDSRDGSDKGIYFHNDDALYSYDNKNKGMKNNNLFSLAHFEKYKVNADKVLNIFFLKHPKDSLQSKSYTLSANGVGTSQWAKIVGAFAYSRDSIIAEDGKLIPRGTWFMASLLNHEIGHSLGLWHTWNINDGCEDTPQNPGCWNIGPPPCDKAVSNNMMDYNACQCALTPCQIGKIQYGFFRESSTSKKYLVENWCELKASANIYIQDSVIWNCKKNVSGEIFILDGGYLEIQCDLSLPKGARIIVKAGATLVLNNCNITNSCNKKWQGILAEKNGNKKSKIVFKNNSVILNVENSFKLEYNR